MRYHKIKVEFNSMYKTFSKKMLYLFHVVIMFLICSSAYSQLAVETFETWPVTVNDWHTFENSFGNHQWAQGTSSVSGYNSASSAFITASNTPPELERPVDYLVTKVFQVPQNPELLFMSSFINNQSTANIVDILLTEVVDNTNLGDPQINSYESIIGGPMGEKTMNPNFSWSEKVFAIDAQRWSGKKVRMAFMLKSYNSGSTQRWRIDDVQVRSKCMKPSNFSVTNRTTNSAIIHWTGNFNSTGWEIQVVKQGHSLSSSAITVNSNSYSIIATNDGQPLIPDNNYEVFVRSICGPDHFSDWSSAFLFRTAAYGELCNFPIEISPSLPYIETQQNFINSQELNGNPGSGCNALPAFLNGNYKVYKFSPISSGNIDITLQSEDKPIGIFLYNSCSDIGVNCLRGNSSSGKIALNNVSVQANNSYYIVIVTSPSNFEKYSFVIEQSQCNDNIEANFTNVSGCPRSEPFTILTDIVNLGSSSSIIAKAFVQDGTTNNVIQQTVTSPSQISFGPFMLGTEVQIVVESSTDNKCIIVSPNFKKEFCKAENDQCAAATNLSAGTVGQCNTTEGTLSSATPSTGLPSCAGNLNPDVWYTFTAVNNTHIIDITNNTGYANIAIKHDLYKDNCNNLTLVYCNKDNYSIATGLVVGQQYKIRVYGADLQPVNADFKICTVPVAPNCTENNPKYNIVKSLFINLINHLVNVGPNIPKGYNCPELIALSEYIDIDNPRIFNFTNSNGIIEFAFEEEGGTHVQIPGSAILEMSLLNYTSTLSMNFLYVRDVDSNPWIGSFTQHINFCPSADCKVLEGTIMSSSGLSCMLPGNKYTFVFLGSVNPVTHQWTIYSNTGTFINSSIQSEPTFSISTPGTYILEFIGKDSNNCQSKIRKHLHVRESCTEYCTENNIRSSQVKIQYLKLINYLLQTYGNGENTAPAIFTCPQLVTLSPYITYNDPKIYNLEYTNDILSFSFSATPTANTPDVVIQNAGYIYDVDISDFSSTSVRYQYTTSYPEGHLSNQHYIKEIDFCPAQVCPETSASIRLTSGLSCVVTGSLTKFYLDANTVNYTDFNWTFYNTDNQSILSVQNGVQIGSLIYAEEGQYLVKLEARLRDTNCTFVFYKHITVSTDLCTDSCTEQNTFTREIKNRYIRLVNYVLSIYKNGGTTNVFPVNSFFQPLSYFVTDQNPVVSNVSYVNGILKLSFSDHGSLYDIALKADAPISDINLMPFSSADSSQSYYTVLADGQVTTEHTIRHINFCPPANCKTVAGEIRLSNGISCVTLNTSAQFEFYNTSGTNYSYTWLFFDLYGNEWRRIEGTTKPTVKYTQEGSYIVKLLITDGSGCITELYKHITVNDSCADSCTETSGTTADVSLKFKRLINKMLSVFSDGGTFENSAVNFELNQLIPYITDTSPGIYNVQYNNNILSFSFSDNAVQPDVMIKNNGMIADINLFSYITPNTGNYDVVYNNGMLGTATIRHINFCPQPEPCRSHIAFVIDESGSINATEASHIKRQLHDFVTQQTETETIISFIGMSDSDTNTRTDHVSDKITSQSEVRFRSWINNYKNGYTSADVQSGISPNSDYWNSGLEYIMTDNRFLIKPDIVIVITDGSQTKNIQRLKNSIARFAEYGSHLYVYGIGPGSYVDGSTPVTNANDLNETNTVSGTTNTLMTSLKYLMGLPQTEFPVSSMTNILLGSYYEHEDSGLLNSDRWYFSNRLEESGLGCNLSSNPKEPCDDCLSFQPEIGKTYWVSGWVREEHTMQVKGYTNGTINIVFNNKDKQKISNKPFFASGDIIDGWQRIAGSFQVPDGTKFLEIELANDSAGIPAYFDDIRIHPIQGSMKSFVYDPETFRLMAEQDDNNYSTYYEYDKEGGLIRIKKETASGIKTIQESRSGTVLKNE